MRLWAGLVAAAVLLAACSGGGDVTVERLETDHALGGPIVAIGDRLIGSDPFGADSYLLYSSTDGRTWDSDVRIPMDDVTGDLLLRWPERAGDVVVVAATQRYEGPGLDGPFPPAFAWISADGERWRGGKVTDHLWGGPPAVRESGGLVLAGAVVDQAFHLWRLDGDDWVEGTIEPAIPISDGVHARLEWLGQVAGGWRALVAKSTGGGHELFELRSDDGRTWTQAPCVEGCTNVLRAGDLLVAGKRASTDGGRSWRRIRTPHGFREPWYIDLIADPNGGWLLANAMDWEVGPEATLLRSDDGFVWEEVRTPRCNPDAGRWPDFAGFVTVDDRLLVGWTCGGEQRATRSQLLEVEGGRTKVVADLPAAVSGLFVHRGVLLAVRHGQDGRLQGFDAITLG